MAGVIRVGSWGLSHEVWLKTVDKVLKPLIRVIWHYHGKQSPLRLVGPLKNKPGGWPCTEG